MKIKIRTDKVHFSMPISVNMAGLLIRAVPEREFAKMRAEAPEPYDRLITKEIALMIYGECKEIIKENKGLEIVHVEAHDGTFVSIKL